MHHGELMDGHDLTDLVKVTVPMVSDSLLETSARIYTFLAYWFAYLSSLLLWILLPLMMVFLGIARGLATLWIVSAQVAAHFAKVLYAIFKPLAHVLRDHLKALFDYRQDSLESIADAIRGSSRQDGNQRSYGAVHGGTTSTSSSDAYEQVP